MNWPAYDNPSMIETNGVTLEVYSAGEGSPEGSPIVLCHGWPEHAFSWRHQVEPLVEAGHHVIVPNQRGYGASDRPEPLEDYDIVHLTGDLVGLLDHYGYDDAVFVGHDWGAIVVWNLAMLHPTRVRGVINLSVPFMERPEVDWVSLFEQALGADFYIVHFNRQPGVADAAFASNPRNLLKNLYRTEQWNDPPRPVQSGMPLINLVDATDPSGKPLMSDEELDVFVNAFEASGFTGGINWYRNFTRNWHILEDVPQRVEQPTLMIHGRYDIVPAFDRLTDYVPNAEVHSLECGHWIQQEQPEQTNKLMLEWLSRL
jgi:pimeloyl-ACP methyl ester carboxylesterase